MARVALVTGGMGGIGSAICRRLSRAGMRIAANCLPGEPRRDEWLAMMRAEGVDVIAAEADVSSFEAARQMVAAIEREMGPVDVLVNCAGITRDSVFRKMAEEDWHQVIDSNLTSVFNVTRQVIEGMAGRGWGRVISLSSVNGTRGQFGQANYSAAKAGMAGFSKALAQEVVKKGVTVNCVSPGYVETAMVRAIRPDVLKTLVDSIPIGRLAQPDEIAAVIAFLASDDAAYITGANIPVNGGLHMYG
jgi:acetoacetyl-CoA reductase